VPSFKYGARQFQIEGNFAAASTTSNSTINGFQYQPAMGPAGYGTVDFAQEVIKQATLIFMANVASAASTAAGGSVIIAASQFNSGGSSKNSANLFNQALGSQAAFVPIDVSTLLNTWNLSPGDSIILFANTNTVGIPASFPGLVLSATIDSVTSS
jgi:hypothetical protein